MIDNPIFIVGTERSGSNLLRLLIHEMGQISTPHPPHLMRDLTPLLENYGDLSDRSQMRRLVRHAIQLVNWHFAPWPIKLREEVILSQIKKPTLYAVHEAIYDAFRRYEDKERWACKSTFMVHHVQDILDHHKRPQFIHLVRDPRDVAVSAKKSIFSFYHPYFVAKLWAKEQNLAAHWRAQLSPQTWYTLRYEDLLEDPEKEVRRLCEFLERPFHLGILQYFRSTTAKNLAAMSQSWENVAQPILKNNRNKFLLRLSEQEVALIENVALSAMEAYGYTPLAEKTSELSPSQIQNYAVLETLMKVKSESEALFKDKNFWRRHRKKVYLKTLKVKALSHLI